MIVFFITRDRLTFLKFRQYQPWDSRTEAIAFAIEGDRSIARLLYPSKHMLRDSTSDSCESSNLENWAIGQLHTSSLVARTPILPLGS